MSTNSSLKFFKEYYQIAYSLVLILIIPTAIIVNTVIFTKALKKNIDQALYNKTISIGQVINASSRQFLANPELLQDYIEQIADLNKEIGSLTILLQAGDDFEIIASLARELIGTKTSEMQNVIAWHQDQPVAVLATLPVNQSKKERFWVVTMPLKNAQGEKQALLSMKVSLETMDQLTQQILIRSYLILALTILIIVLLLANNTRLFEYATLYRRLKEVDQMKDEFVSMASHELRTPVTAIKGYTSLILDGTYGEITSEVKEGAELVFNSANRLNTLVEDLLNVSRIEQGRLKIEPKPLEASPIIENIIKELKVQADEKGLTVSYQPAATKLPLINVDPDRFKQVLINIIGNAIKYTPQGGVEIVAEDKDNGKKLEIRVKDTGIGMDAKERERLFEKFYRVENERTRNIIGTGLGLWITKQIIELMRGAILVDSIKGVGTQVTLIFPVIKGKKGGKE